MSSALDYGVVDVADVVKSVLHLQVEERGDELDMLCPRPEHNDSHPSCSVNTRTGYWSCFSCGAGGDLADLAMITTGSSYMQVIRMLRPSTADSLLAIVQHRLASATSAMRDRGPTAPTALPGPYDSGPTWYLRQRGFTKDTISRWGVRWVTEDTLPGKKNPFTIKESVSIPIRDSNGHLLAWCYRATDASPQWQRENARYLYTPGIEISDLWFGPANWTPHNTDYIVVVEGALDAMWCDQNGIPAWALLGSKMGDRKILKLADFPYVVLLGDLDNAGAQWVERVSDIIGSRTSVGIAQYRSWMTARRLKDGNVVRATDPEVMYPFDLEYAVATAVPYIKWRTRNLVPA